MTAQEPPSPLLNFWSLAVEEQFYLVYPAFFAVLALLYTRISLRVKLAIGLTAVIVISLIISAAQTNTSPTAAYFSPFARAWELALGALIAVGTTWLLRVPKVAAGNHDVGRLGSDWLLGRRHSPPIRHIPERR